MLDMRTMAFASSVSGFLMAATMLGIYHAGMRARAMLDWLVAGLALGTGYLVGTLSLLGAFPLSGSFAAGLANLLISLGHTFVLVGIQRYLGNRTGTVWLIGIVAALFVAGLVLAPLRESLAMRILVYSILHLVLSGWAGVLLWRSERPGMRAYHRMAAAVLLGFSAVIAFRFLVAVAPSGAIPVGQGDMQTIAFLAAMIFGFLLTMAFAVMMFREKQVELADLAEKDPLTGMNNRLSLDAIAERYMRRAEGQGMPLSIVLFDLDHFKRVNDEFGHQVGDRVLSEIAHRIGRIIRGDDVAFRFGGEEFLALLPGASLEQAERVAERLRAAIGEEPVEIDEHRLELTASFGVVQYTPGREGWNNCVKRVDDALYRAKRGGRDRISRHVPVLIAAPG
jgi:diguanylate cyclase (GGDEF)-like protein